jgi:hypothetical protein
VTPNGCRHCGVSERNHSQRLQRMRERRTQPSNSKAAEAPTSTAHHNPDSHHPKGAS